MGTLEEQLNDFFDSNQTKLNKFPIIKVIYRPITIHIHQWLEQFENKDYFIWSKPNKNLAWTSRKAPSIKSQKRRVLTCFGFTNEIPKTVNELDKFSHDAFLQSAQRDQNVGKIAIAYTVWSKKKGGGKLIVKEVFKKIKKSNHLNRLITLSPLTDIVFLKLFILRLTITEFVINF